MLGVRTYGGSKDTMQNENSEINDHIRRQARGDLTWHVGQPEGLQRLLRQLGAELVEAPAMPPPPAPPPRPERLVSGAASPFAPPTMNDVIRTMAGKDYLVLQRDRDVDYSKIPEDPRGTT